MGDQKQQPGPQRGPLEKNERLERQVGTPPDARIVKGTATPTKKG